jgi:hypothetical protein
MHSFNRTITWWKGQPIVLRVILAFIVFSLACCVCSVPLNFAGILRIQASTPPRRTALTAQEAHDLALTRVRRQYPDAVVTEMATGLDPLNPEGRAARWILDVWSPSTHWYGVVHFDRGSWLVSPSPLPAPQAQPLGDRVILDTKLLYRIAERAGGAKFTAQGYRPTASTYFSWQNPTRPLWQLDYGGGNGGLVYLVDIDAVTGEVTDAHAFGR